MIDFGLSQHFNIGDIHIDTVGTPYAVAPEVINGMYDEQSDLWAIGVIAFLLHCGDPPFGGCGGPESLMQIRSSILSAKFKFEPKEIWCNVSQSARDFICQLLVLDPQKRPTARQCQKSSWMLEWRNKERIKGDTTLNPNVIKALVDFKELSDLQKLLCKVLSFTLLPGQIADLRKEFEKLDVDCSGEITLLSLKALLCQGPSALKEEEVECIFNVMHVGKTATCVHWHEFIAAVLRQCKVDERNLKLAFDRLDSDHKGYITFENIRDLMGRDAADSEDDLRLMWDESMNCYHIQNSQITYESFLLSMAWYTEKDLQCIRPSVSTLCLSDLSGSLSSLRFSEEKTEKINIEKKNQSFLAQSHHIGLYGNNGEEFEEDGPICI